MSDLSDTDETAPTVRRRLGRRRRAEERDGATHRQPNSARSRQRHHSSSITRGATPRRCCACAPDVLFRRFEEKSADRTDVKIALMPPLNRPGGGGRVTSGLMPRLRLRLPRPRHALVMVLPDEVMAELYGQTAAREGQGRLDAPRARKHFLGGTASRGQIPWRPASPTPRSRGTDQATLCFFGGRRQPGRFPRVAQQAQLGSCGIYIARTPVRHGHLVSSAMSISTCRRRRSVRVERSRVRHDVLAVRAATRGPLSARAQVPASRLRWHLPLHGPLESDHGHYRTRARSSATRARPHQGLRRHLREKSARREGSRASRRASARGRARPQGADASEPAPEELFTDIYATPINKQ